MSTAKKAIPGKFLLRALIRAILLVAITLVLFLPVLFSWMLCMERQRVLLVRFYYGSLRYICGIRLTVHGEVSALRPLMLVANHTSYLDIIILGSLMPLSFTPKQEIRRWPIIGFFCILADSIFIERRPADMQRAQGEMVKRLSRGKVVALFPEGTTGDGFTVKRFKSGFLNLAENYDLPLQPVSLAYTHIGRTPLSAETRDLVAWIGEASLVTHLTRLLSFPCVRVTACIHDVKHMRDFADRKALAQACETTIAQGLKATLEANGVRG